MNWWERTKHLYEAISSVYILCLNVYGTLCGLICPAYSCSVSTTQPETTWLHIDFVTAAVTELWLQIMAQMWPYMCVCAIWDMTEIYNKSSPKQTNILQHRNISYTLHPPAGSGLQSEGVFFFGCTGRRWQRSSITPAPPTGCWSIPLLRPIWSPRLILFQLISINVCVWVLSNLPLPSSRAPPLDDLVCKC